MAEPEVYVVVPGNAYWTEDGVKCHAPINIDGAVDWESGGEIDSRADVPDYDAAVWQALTLLNSNVVGVIDLDSSLRALAATISPEAWVRFLDRLPIATADDLFGPISVAETDDNEFCKKCGVAVYRTQTASGTRWAHVGTKVLFCTTTLGVTR